ncbi:Histone acetyltransferase KAT7 [Dirofilaria immitis]
MAITTESIREITRTKTSLYFFFMNEKSGRSENIQNKEENLKTQDIFEDEKIGPRGWYCSVSREVAEAVDKVKDEEMKTRKATSQATKASKKRQQLKTFGSGKRRGLSAQAVLSSGIIENNDSKSKRIAVAKRARFNSRIPAASSIIMKKGGKVRVKVREYKQQDIPFSTYSPIKTRGLYKKQSRGTDHCRLCKINAVGFMICSLCENKYHLECLGYAPESARLVFEKRFYTWLCPTCTYCCSCNEFIYDPENVQCFACDAAFHGSCRPNSGAWMNPNDPFSSWFCEKCKHLLDIENSESSDCSSSASSSLQENESAERKSYFWHLRHDYTTAYLWKAKLQAERDTVNDQLRDFCRQYLKRKEEKEKNKMKQQIKNGNFSPKKITAKNPKKIKRSDLENESARNIKIVDGIKIFVHGKQDVSEQLTKAEKHRAMKDNSTAFDYNLYTAAKKKFRESQPSEDLIADEERPPQTQWIQFGSERLLAMYSSPYPKRIAQSSNVHICRFCLIALEDSTLYEIHTAHCEWKHPPGNEIYRDDRLSFWEIDGIDEIAYCRRLCLLSKLFLFSKTLHHEVETFMFYILTEYTTEGCVLLGYFSKEKNPSKNNNLSCLLTLPSSQRTGYGKFLIDLSYKLSLRERKIGGPEHPLSDMGLITYRSYWKAVIICYIRKRRPLNSISIKEMSNETGIHSSDIVSTMLENKMLRYHDGNYLINKKKAFAAPLRIFRRRVVHDEKLIWEPEFDVEDAVKKMGTYVD